MPSATGSLRGWPGGCCAAAILALFLTWQGQGVAERPDGDPERLASPGQAQSNGENHPARPSSTLAALAQETLDGIGDTTPTVWAANAISVTEVVPAENALDVPVSTNVTVTFSEAVDPATVTTGSFRLLDPAQLPVPAQVSVGPAGVRATLDPDAALGFSQLYTVELTDAIGDGSGDTLVPFTSQFATAAEPPDEELPDVADEATPPPNATQAKTGSALSAAGDLNGDGIADFLTGAPGLEVGGKVETGAALVYFGSAVSSERVQPDIIFEGVAAHDRTGVSVAGDFDFNGDTIPDILIGVEQVNRSGADDPVAGCDDGAPCGSGKVYLIYFDPLDLTHYPNIADPLVTDVVDLALVGSAIPGVVFTGSHGDQVGFAVAGGGRIDAGLGQDLAIGAPGGDPGTPARTDAGVVYVVFDDPTLSGTVALGRLANGEADEVDGVVYLGGADGDNLGFAVAFPGDVMGTIGDDLAMGAPGTDNTPVSGSPAPTELVPDGGQVISPLGGSTVNGIIESTDIGGGSPGTRIQGDQPDMGLGYSLAGGGDSFVDGEGDLLIGAPLYDAEDPVGQPLVDAGVVAHTASKLQHGVIDVSQIGADPEVDPDAVSGALYTGVESGAQLGATVAGLGDVTGDGFDDAALGAPFDDPLVEGVPVLDAGTVYVVEGLVVPDDLHLGFVPASAVGESVAGQKLVGTEAEEHASLALASTGDLDNDNDPDFLVGAPDRDAVTIDDDAGIVYIVLQSEPTLPGLCGPEGCVVADLDTGAQILVPAGSLTLTIGMAVRGVTELVNLPVPPPVSMMLMGAADFDPENQGFGAPLPTIHVPLRPGLERQLVGGEQLGLWHFSGGAWVASGVTGTVEANPHYPNLAALAATIDTLHFYATFGDDADGDGYWDTIDSDPGDQTVCADTDGDTCDDCTSGTFDPESDGVDTDGDGTCDLNDACTDVDGDGVGNGNLGNTGCVTTTTDIDDGDPTSCADDDGDTCDDCSSGAYDPANDGTDTDNDGLCDLGDPDDDNDGVDDSEDSDPLDPFVCRDVDSDTCDDCTSGSADPANDGTDTDSDGLCDLGDPDDDNDGVDDTEDSDPLDPFVCRDVDSDTCDDCTSGSDDPANDGTDTDSDGLCDLGDPDDDNDGVDDTEDSDPLDPFVCRDVDSDTCDDCTSGSDDPANDGTDTDNDGLCDLGDPDDDNDGVDDTEDSDPLDPFVCRDVDSDTCDDCTSGSDDPANDGTDTDNDGLCDLGDPDDDNDGVDDTEDSDPLDPFVCRDVDSDTCDDCTSGSDDPANDGTDTDSDGLCDLGDPDDDNDGVDDTEDSDPLDPFVCRDVDSDTCDDCTSGSDDPANDGTDTDSDGLCDLGDPDDDNDGVDDTEDSDPLDPFVCRDVDSDTCDDCTSGSDDPANDGTDTDSDGLCDLGDPDDDNDGVDDTEDSDPLDPFVCRDVDSDTCDDCTSGSDDPANDGTDTDSDGLCDLGDPDDDNDGVDDTEDSDPLDPFVCRDVDSDTCDDCTSGSDDPANDGTDTDNDGLCDLGDPDDDNDGVDDTEDSDPLDPFVCRDVDSDTCDDCTSGSDDPANDGTDTDNDGICDASDDCTDVDGDGVGNGILGNAGCVTTIDDSNDGDPTICADEDGDTCDDCSSGSYDPSSDGTDTDSDGACNLGDPDDDNDGVADGADCLPLDSQSWSLPGPVVDMAMIHAAGTTTISWTAPTITGTAVPLLYDTVRSNDPSDWVTTAACVDSDGTDTESTDSDPLAPGTIVAYLVRSENGCGPGPTGLDETGQPRVVVNCP